MSRTPSDSEDRHIDEALTLSASRGLVATSDLWSNIDHPCRFVTKDPASTDRKTPELAEIQFWTLVRGIAALL
jgi:hypothetical protein